MKNRIEVTGKNNEEQEVTYYVVKPGAEDYVQAQNYANKTFRNALDSGALFRDKLVEYMMEQGLWDAEKTKKEQDYTAQLEEKVKTLNKGGIKLSEGKKLAVEIRNLRLLQLILSAKKTELDAFTVEGQTDNARFDYLAYCCIKDEEGERVFNSLEDYKNNGDSPVVLKAANALYSLVYNIDDDWQKKLPENEFLLKYGFVNEDLRFINKDGKLVDSEGRLIDENGKQLNEDGSLIQTSVEEFSPFLDDDGNPVE